MVRLGFAIVAANPTTSAGDDPPLHSHGLEMARAAAQLAELLTLLHPLDFGCVRFSSLPLGSDLGFQKKFLGLFLRLLSMPQSTHPAVFDDYSMAAMAFSNLSCTLFFVASELLRSLLTDVSSGPEAVRAPTKRRVFPDSGD